jgi:site-specific recombinase XerD
VFGTETGERVRSVRRQWEDAVLKAHGQTPLRARGKLTADSQKALRAIDLHVHDFRREFASRLLESSADLHDVQMFLGHAAITTTSRYLQSTPVRLEKALAKLEAAAGFAHDSHNVAEQTATAASDSAAETASNVLN